MLLKEGGDYGWPECYYDQVQAKLVLAPEYGGNGGKAVGVCSNKLGPAAAFPAHWAPNGMVFYDQKQFPARYRGGVFIAFHGSWNRAPYPQGGYNVVFQSLTGSSSSHGCEVFADGFAGGEKTPEGAAHRPSGVAVGPDGSLYVSDDMQGRIYKITYTGGTGTAGGEESFTPCPAPNAPAGEIVRAGAKPPEGTHPDAGATAASNLPVPAGATPAMVALGDRIFHGQEASGTCTACHGVNATGTPLGPDLTKNKWLWSDGSWAGITKSIADGVPQPKQYRSAMPPMGGTQLTPEQASAVGAYIWSLNQH
jgi:mono/diheme cytochrome c family protein